MSDGRSESMPSMGSMSGVTGRRPAQARVSPRAAEARSNLFRCGSDFRYPLGRRGRIEADVLHRGAGNRLISARDDVSARTVGDVAERRAGIRHELSAGRRHRASVSRAGDLPDPGASGENHAAGAMCSRARLGYDCAGIHAGVDRRDDVLHALDAIGCRRPSVASASTRITLSTAPSSGLNIAPSACDSAGSSSWSSFESSHTLVSRAVFLRPLIPFALSATCRIPSRLSGTATPVRSARNSMYDG